MQRQILEKFILKYNLSGAAEAVKWKADGHGLHLNFCSDDKNVVGFISAKNIEFDEGEYSIFETAQFRNLLSVLGDEIKIQVKKDDRGPFAFLMTDGTVKVLFALSDSSVIPVASVIKALPTPELVITIDTKFRESFVRAKAALSDVEDFTVSSDGDMAQILLGHDTNANTHNVAINLDVSQNAVLNPLRFNAQYMKEILTANKEMPSCTMTVSSKGLAHMQFENDQFVANYYLLQKK
jgi:hypothetical protein